MELENETYMKVAEVRQLLLLETAYVHGVNNHATTVGTVERTHNLEQCRLSRSTGTNDAHHLALVDMQVDALEHLQRAETLPYIL